MTRTKLFAWDFHGTLEEGTEVGFADILKRLAKEINYETRIELEEVRRLFGLSVLDYLKHFFPKLTNNELIDLRTKIRTSQNRKHILKFVKSAPYAHDVLSKIKKAGHKNIAVSTSHRPHIKRFLKVVDMLEYFDEIIGIDRHSLDTAFDIAKEKAKVISRYAQKNKFSSNKIVVVGDRTGDIDAGLIIKATTYQYISKYFPNVETNAKYKIADLRKILKEI